ncbi:GNAT family N-acetyltransferase [Stutzerimonas nitrititolerans]|uniref:GNAT family N-acetyltransferase n=1 Tax=Stutzerimonas nitrititolerans TaxID=2482751 RepID=UPI0028A60952|nr:GNAT family N-acetyltransferase [Stutzerimonas nitrititolerans]
MSLINMEARTIRLRLVEISDAAFILKLRQDERYNRFLSQVNNDIDAQVSWIERYKNEEAKGSQYYFIIERLDGTPCGTVRVYDRQENSFSWGSWILNEDKTRYAALESAFLIYRFGFDILGYKQSHFEVMKGNDGVVSFHKKMGATEVGQDEVNFYFNIEKSAVEAAKDRLRGKIL